jgi:protease I
MAKIAMPVGEGFEDSELSEPCARLKNVGHEIVTIGVERGERIWGKRGETMATIDAIPDDVDPSQFDALVIPGGHSPDALRLNQSIVSFVRRFSESGKLVAAICHGPQLLIEADAVAGRELTSWPSIRKDLENADARWVDREVVEDGNLITSRGPEDLDAFCDAILGRLPLKIGQAHASAPIG